MTEVKWSYNQFEAYAKAFEEGDAVRAGGTWYEVVKDRKVLNESREFSGLTVRGAKNLFRLNYNVDDRVEGVVAGFTNASTDKYEIVTLKDHEVKAGDKLVWLGEGYEHWSLGGVYAAYSDRYGKIVTYDGDGVERTPKSENWGIIPRYETVKQKNDVSGKSKRSGNAGKFKKGNRVKVTSGSYKGSEGSIEQSDEVGGGLSYVVLFDDGRDRWFEEEFLELVEDAEKSPEQEAFDYLLSRGRDAVRGILEEEVAIWAKVHFRHKDYDELRQAIDILERLEEGE